MVQVLGYLSAADAAEFRAHAASGGLDASALANLLIVRELKLARLAELQKAFAADAALSDRTKIIAHQPDDRIKSAFTKHAKDAGLKPSPAAAVLFKAELKERWLSRCLVLEPVDSA